QRNLLSFPALEASNGAAPLFAGGATLGGRFEPLDPSRMYEDHTHAFYEDEGTGTAPLKGAPLQPINFKIPDGARNTAAGK
ncbi:MAG: hypothetical protein KC933_38225, partial [Myxococcales bacterium]|nr:hypothetical protein [Myxococcales bacterium]